VTSLALVVVAALIIGILPRPFFQYMDKSSGDVAAQMQRYVTTPASAQAPIVTAQGGDGK
jgi:NADH:ubiquinone oxidoreductase subunit 4 (subunit M)